MMTRTSRTLPEVSVNNNVFFEKNIIFPLNDTKDTGSEAQLGESSV
mgnify:CR=1 FL=1